jgi:hypothetical protein
MTDQLSVVSGQKKQVLRLAQDDSKEGVEVFRRKRKRPPRFLLMAVIYVEALWWRLSRQPKS